MSVATNSEGPRGADPARRPGKRDRLVAAALELTYLNGIAATSLADIAQAAQVPVGNVYYYFKTKDDLIGAVVQAYAEQLDATLAELERVHARPQARLKALVGVLVERAATSIARYGAQYGCPYGTLSSELAKKTERPDPLAAQLIQLPLDWAEQQFGAMGRGDAHSLAVELMASYQGAAILTSILRQPQIMADQARRLQEWIDALEG